MTELVIVIGMVLLGGAGLAYLGARSLVGPTGTTLRYLWQVLMVLAILCAIIGAAVGSIGVPPSGR